jgi:two-component system LytT family response regulator
MLKIIIVDDEKKVAEALSQMLDQFCENVQLAAICNSVDSAIKAIREHQPDILFLDVEMGKEKGFDLFKHFPKPEFKVIFITAHQQYAIQAFRFAALDYLLKPVDPVLLAEVIEKAGDIIEREKTSTKIEALIHNMSVTSNESKKIVLRTNDKIHVIGVNDIMYCEAEGSYTNFYLNDKNKIMVSKNMGEYEEMLDKYGFFRVHQSYLLNLSYLKRYEKGDGGSVVLKNDHSLPVATRKKDRLLDLLSRF